MSKEKTDFVIYLFNLESCLLFKVWNVLVLLCSSQWLSAQQLAIVATTLNRMAPSVWFRARHTKHETQIKYSPPICQILQNFTEGKARKVTVSFAFCAHIIVIKYRKKKLSFTFERAQITWVVRMLINSKTWSRDYSNIEANVPHTI